jgi:hypothetical protein
MVEVNYKDTFLADDLNRILSDKQTAEYLDGVFSVIRNIVGYTTIVNDMVFAEVMKSEPDKNVIVEIFNECDKKLNILLDSITEAHQLVSQTHITDLTQNPVIDFSDKVQDAFDKAKKLLAGNFKLQSDIEPFVFSYASETDVEILLSGMIYKVIIYEIPPAVISVSLKKNEEGDRATLSVSGLSDGSLPVVKSLSETEILMQTSAMMSLFAHRFCEAMGGFGTVTEGDKGLELTVEMDIVPDWETPRDLHMSASVDFKFDNERFSPTTLKLDRFSNRKTYSRDQKKEER